ncbi:MAG: esterase [Chloracidobacterium sp.]|nr:esterase [Chloracidobacterium sp.]MCO5332866.1 hypothetical protein [Pyrinomonadaceae bacterium]
MRTILFAAAAIFLFAVQAFPQNYQTFNVDGVQRKAIIFAGAGKTKSSPVVFFFHGHGGNADFAARRFRFHDAWKDAIVVYMEGIPGVGLITDKEGVKNGWQNAPGTAGDRDLKFFDAVLKQLHKDYKVDDKRVYAAGFSNGARFVYVLWAARGDKFAAFCAVAAPGGRLIQNAAPRSIWVSMGENDPIVPIRSQKASLNLVEELLDIDVRKGVSKGDTVTYKGRNDTELAVQIRKAGHQFPTDSISDIVAFFKRNTKH